MKIGDDFTEIGNVAKGELVFKLPGTDLKMPYEEGKVFLSASGLGYVSLPIRRVEIQEVGEPEGMGGMMGRMLARQLQDPEGEEALHKILAECDHTLFYARRKDGIEVLTIPGMGNEDTIDRENMPEMVVATYLNKGIVSSLEHVYALHQEAIGKEKIITDRAVLEKDIRGLVEKANRVYERALQLMKQSLF